MSLPRAGVRSDFRRFEELEHEIEELGHEIEELEHEIEELEDEIEELEEELEHEIEKLKIMLVEKTSYGVLSGLEVTAQDEPDMSVNVSEGIIYMQDGERFEVEADTMAVVEADAENPRIDIIYINGTGVVSYMPGIAAAEPTAPETPLSSQLLAEIAVAANATAIETANITDKRKTITN
jgi:TolA-binding protein